MNSVKPQSLVGILPEDITDHFPIFLCFPTRSDRKTNQQTKNTEQANFRDFSKRNIDHLIDRLKETNWKNVLDETDPSNACKTFHSSFSCILDQTCPFISNNDKPKKHAISQPWFTPGLKVSSKKKNKMYKKALKNPCRMTAYRKYRNLYNRLVRLAKCNYYNKRLNETAHDIKGTWKILREIIPNTNNKNKCPVTSIQLNILNKTDNFTTSIDDTGLICEFFNNYFSSIGERISASIGNTQEINPIDYLKDINVSDSLFLLPASEEEVIEIAMSIKSKSSTGHDEISNKLLKLIIPYIVKPLVHIFNQSFQTGTFPDSYKIAKVIPVFKSGKKTDPNNYRPISLLPSISKILEKLIYKRMISFLFSHDLIHPHQYGFLSGRSTEHAMLDIILKIIDAIEHKNFSLGIFLDLSKAFDSISHNILLNKLSLYGIRGTSLDLFKSYLTNRLQYVHIKNLDSNLQNVTCGVPQGSVLGPLLFLLYINDMPLISSLISYILYADDTTGLYSSPSLDDLFSTVQTELNNLNNWFCSNKLRINVTKTNFVLFMTRQKETSTNLSAFHNLQISSLNIDRKEQTKFLGLLLDKNLNFQCHINHVCTKILKGIFALSRSAKILPTKVLKTLYSAIVLPYLNYGLLAWGGSPKLFSKFIVLHHGQKSHHSTFFARLHRLQKRAIRIVAKIKQRSHHIPLCYDLQILDLEDLYNTKALSFFHDFFHGKLPPFFSNAFELHYSRNNQLIIKTKYRRTDTAAASIIHTLPGIWNALDKNLQMKITKSKPTFIKHCKTFFFDKYKNWHCDTINCYTCK